MRDLAIQAATAAKLNSFAAAYNPDPSQACRIEASFAKTCSQTSKLTNICNSGLVKQICFIMPNYKVGILTNPLISQDPTNEDIIIGSLGDSDVIHPVTLRLHDVTADILSVCTSRANAEKYKLATSASNPIEEAGPPPQMTVSPCQSHRDLRINIVIDNPDNVPCFVAMPKDSLINTWFETLRYGIVNLGNYSLQAQDNLFVYAGLDQEEFTGPNRVLASRCTVHIDALDFDSPNYRKVVSAMRQAKEEANFTYGSKLLAEQGLATTVHETPTQLNNQAPNAPAAVDQTGMSFSKASPRRFQSTSKSLGIERERASEAADATRFYQLLFASAVDIIQEDGTTASIIMPAKIHPLFHLSWLPIKIPRQHEQCKMLWNQCLLNLEASTTSLHQPQI
ncbi:hypothetical protein MHU86_12882 [Fragilaria crotonensis]|nr:hypothetical protein MHU86_12882 [Fragilaria crotonensis]